MSIRTASRDLLAAHPRIDGLFRREIWSRIHFPEVEMRFLQSLPPGSIDIAIDVGAAHGSYAWILNRKSRLVYAFEPGEQHARYLDQTIGGTLIRLVKAAVGSDCGHVTMYTPGSDTDALCSATLSAENPIIGSPRTQVRQVEQVSLDSFFVDKLDQGRSIDLLKVDVEGYEHQVFQGAQALLARHKPLIICEIEARHNADYARVFDLLRALGYRCFVFRDGAFASFDSDQIEPLQNERDLMVRLSREYNPKNNRYINNFVFQHNDSRIKVKP
jgi:FkbM family methyltransferase